MTDDTNFFANNTFGVRGTPTNFLLGADGKVVFRYSSGAEKTMEAEIRELLGLDPFQGQETNTESTTKNR